MEKNTLFGLSGTIRLHKTRGDRYALTVPAADPIVFDEELMKVIQAAVIERMQRDDELPTQPE